MRSFSVVGFVALLSTTICACTTHSSSVSALPVIPHGPAPYVRQSGQPPVNWEEFQAYNVSSYVSGFALGADGNVWFTICCNAWGFGKITLDGTVTVFNVPQEHSGANLVPGPKSRLWYAELFQDIGSIATDGTTTDYQIPIPNEIATSVTIGPDRNIWFSEEQSPGKQMMVGRMRSDGHFFTPFQVSGGNTMATGSDGRVWIPQINSTSINAVTVTGQNTTYCCLQEPAIQIVPGPDGNLWFAEKDYIGKITTSGTITEYSEPTSLGISSLGVGPDKRIWFTSFNSPWIGRISLSGQTKFFQNPFNNTPERSIIKGRDGNLWFANYNDVEVLIRLVLSVQPSSITFTGNGQQQTITVSETKYTGGWTATSLNPTVATVAPASQNTFTVTSVGSGSTSIDVADSKNNDFLVSVTVP